MPIFYRLRQGGSIRGPAMMTIGSGLTSQGVKALSEEMDTRLLYRSRLLVAGLCLLLFGTGNWFMGALKFAQYQKVVAEGIAKGFHPRPPGAGGVINVLRPASEEGERYNIARSRLDLYHVVMSGGRLMVGLGVLLSAIAWARIRLRSN